MRTSVIFCFLGTLMNSQELRMSRYRKWKVATPCKWLFVDFMKAVSLVPPMGFWLENVPFHLVRHKWEAASNIHTG